MKKQQRLAARTKMVGGGQNGIGLGESVMLCFGYPCRGRRHRGCEQPVRKKAKANNSLTSTQDCKCGDRDHQRVSSRNCPWKGLSKKEVLLNYEKRMKDIQERQPGKVTDVTVTHSTGPTRVVVQSTGKLEMQRRNLRHTNFV